MLVGPMPSQLWIPRRMLRILHRRGNECESAEWSSMLGSVAVGLTIPLLSIVLSFLQNSSCGACGNSCPSPSNGVGFCSGGTFSSAAAWCKRNLMRRCSLAAQVDAPRFATPGTTSAANRTVDLFQQTPIAVLVATAAEQTRCVNGRAVHVSPATSRQMGRAARLSRQCR